MKYFYLYLIILLLFAGCVQIPLDSGNGTNGINGIDGYTPIKNIDYFDGINGTNGINGINGTNGYNITYNITNNITNYEYNNIYTYYNFTNNITYNIYYNFTNNITYNITNNITYNITNNITNNIINNSWNQSYADTLYQPICINIINSSNITYNISIPLNASVTASGCSVSNWSSCYDELQNSQWSNGNVTRIVNNSLSVAWMNSDSSCLVSNLQSGGNCNIGSVSFSQYCMVTDEFSQVLVQLSGGNNQTRMDYAYNTLLKINSSYGKLPGWRIIVNETSGQFLSCDSRTNSNCDTASDADARIIRGLYTASNNSLFNNQTAKNNYFSLANSMIADMYNYEIEHTCYNSSLGNGAICYWMAGGSSVKASGFSSNDYAYSGYFGDGIIAFAMGCVYNQTYCAVSGNLSLNYLQASKFNGINFSVSPGKSFKWVNVTGGNSTPLAICTTNCLPDKWENADAPRAMSLGLAKYYSNRVGINQSNLTTYLKIWNASYLGANTNSVVTEYYSNGTASQTAQSGYFAQGLQSQALLGVDLRLYNQSLSNAIGHYSSTPKTFDYTSCFGVYGEAMAITSLMVGIGRDINSFPNNIITNNNNNSCNYNIINNITTYINNTNNITYNITNNITNNITYNITYNITNNITTYINNTNNITYNITNNITTYINNTNNITYNITNNITTYINNTNNITYNITNNITNNITYNQTNSVINITWALGFKQDLFISSPAGISITNMNTTARCTSFGIEKNNQYIFDSIGMGIDNTNSSVGIYTAIYNCTSTNKFQCTTGSLLINNTRFALSNTGFYGISNTTGNWSLSSGNYVFCSSSNVTNTQSGLIRGTTGSQGTGSTLQTTLINGNFNNTITLSYTESNGVPYVYLYNNYGVQ